VALAASRWTPRPALYGGSPVDAAAAAAAGRWAARRMMVGGGSALPLVLA
jgi:hypothetical protein